MSNVAPFPGSKVPEPFDPAPVIKALEELLDRAKAGEISCFVVGFVRPDSAICTLLGSGDLPHAHHLTAAALYALRRAENNSGIGDD